MLRDRMEILVFLIGVFFAGVMMIFEPECDYVDVSTEVITCAQIRIEQCSLTSGEYSADGSLGYNQASGYIIEDLIYVVTYQREDNSQMNTLKLPTSTNVCPIKSGEKPYIEIITETPCDGGYGHKKHYLLHNYARITIVVHVPQEEIDKLLL